MNNLDQTIQQLSTEVASMNIPREIKSDEQMAAAASFLKEVKQKYKKNLEFRKFFTDPIDKQKKDIMNLFRPIQDSLSKTEKYLKNIMLDYNKKKEEELKALQKEEPTAIVEAPKKTIRTASATASFKKVWTFEVLNETDVPMEYFSLDERKIRDAISGGNRSIKGLRIYQEDSLSVR